MFLAKGCYITHQMRDFLFTFIVTNITFKMCREETCYCIGSDSKEEVFPF